MNNSNSNSNNQYQRYISNTGASGGTPTYQQGIQRPNQMQLTQQQQLQLQQQQQQQQNDWMYTNNNNSNSGGSTSGIVPFWDVPSNQQRYSLSQDGNPMLLNPFGRGYSIVNGNIMTSGAGGSTSGTNNAMNPNQQVLRQPSYSKRNSSMSTFFLPNDPTTNELDIFRKDSMKPPMLIPQVSQQQNSSGTNGNRLSNSSTEFETFMQQQQPLQQQQQQLAAAQPGAFYNPRNLKFNDDFNFQFRSRKSSMRDSLDSGTSGTSGTSGRLSQVGPQISIDPLRKRSIQLLDPMEEEHINTPSLNSNTNNYVVDDNDIQIDTHMDPLHKRRSTLNTKNKKKKFKKNKKKGKIDKQDIETSSDHENEDDNLKLVGSTKVDQLMLMIQARQKGITDKVKTKPNGELILEENSGIMPPKDELVGGIEKPKIDLQSSRPLIMDSNGDVSSLVSGSNMVSIKPIANTIYPKDKRYQCQYCHKYFSQPTHLEVHIRSHVGRKPFKCKFCGRHFTQGGNLRTHQKLHTGEKPYSCDVCFKKFSRKGNLAAHLLTHQNIKPFICRLDNCNKGFTQLGNMKAHQNRFHLQTLLELTNKLATMETDINSVPESEKDLLNYFASIYKNSNKGIKGRGKGSTKIVPNNDLLTSPMSITSEHTNPRVMSGNIDTQQMVENGNYTTAPHTIQHIPPVTTTGPPSIINPNQMVESSLSQGIKQPQLNQNTTPKPQQTQPFVPQDALVGNILQLTGNGMNNSQNVSSTVPNPNVINNYQMTYPVKPQSGTTSDNIPNSINTASLLSNQDPKFQLDEGPD